MSALAEALVAAQSRAVGALQEQYAAGKLEPEAFREKLATVGLTDDVDADRLIAALDLIREYGAALPSEPAPNGNYPSLPREADKPRTVARRAVDQDAGARGHRHVEGGHLRRGPMERAVLSGEPDPKSRTLARGQRRYRRKIASPKQWQAIIAAKRGPCRVTVAPKQNGGTPSTPQLIEFHHLVSRAQGGDDVPDNIVPLSSEGHRRVEANDPDALAALAASLTDSERAYVVGKLGEDGLLRLFGRGATSAR